jgi:hypothetical protein
MPKLNRRRSHSRSINPKTKLSFNAVPEKNNDDSPPEDEPELLYSADEGEHFDFTAGEMLENIGGLYSLCADFVSDKYLSTLIYVALRHFGYSWRDVDSFLCTVGGMTAETCQKHSQIFLNKDIDVFCADGRGGKQCASFYDLYPELEALARAFTVEACSRKECSFTLKELADYIDEQFYILTGDNKVDQRLARSIPSLRLDLRRWGIFYSSNKIRPYWIGHERQDVVEHRERVVNYFLSREDHYYTVTNGEHPQWVHSVSPDPVIILCELPLFKHG